MNAAVSTPALDTDQLGAFARIFQRDSAAALAEAFVVDQLTQVQLNLSALGLPTIPDPSQLKNLDAVGLRQAFTSRGRRIWGVSATYNAAHPDSATRRAQTTQAAHFIAGLGVLGPVAATLCTGTRSADNMWKAHPDNTSESAWSDLRRSLDELLPAAALAGVMLAVEPEPGNVVQGAAAAQRLLDELGDDARHVGIILDPANLVSGTSIDEHERILRDAFNQLGAKAICVHAKDVQTWSDTLAGSPGVDYRLVLRLYEDLPAAVPLIVQDATEQHRSAYV